MNVRKAVAGSVLAAGVGVAAMIGAGTASAAPGISYDNGSGPVGIGDQTENGAQASATEGNQALAVSLIDPASAVVGSGTGNYAVTLGNVVTVLTNVDTGVSSVTSVSMCGTSFTGQADHVTVSSLPDGVC